MEVYLLWLIIANVENKQRAQLGFLFCSPITWKIFSLLIYHHLKFFHDQTNQGDSMHFGLASVEISFIVMNLEKNGNAHIISYFTIKQYSKLLPSTKRSGPWTWKKQPFCALNLKIDCNHSESYKGNIC